MRRWRRPRSWFMLTLSLSIINVSFARPSRDSFTTDISIYTSDAAPHTQSRALAPHAIPPRSLTPHDYGFQNFLHLGGGWNLYYSSWPTSIFPVQPAVWALRQLYTSMEVNGGSIWRLSPPRYEIPLRVGNVLLTMESNQPIEWDLVSAFGTKLLYYMDRGFVGLYSLMLSHAANDATVFVSLKVIDKARGLRG